MRAVESGASDDPLAGVATARPRLMATRAAIARTQRLLQQNPTAQKWQGEVAAQADLMLGLPPLTPTWVHDPRETSAAPLPLVRPGPLPEGSATTLEIARLFCLRMQTLGITWLVTGDIRYRDRAKSELLAMCAFSDWAGDEFLVTAETAFGAAIGYDWLHDALTDDEREQVVRAIVDQAIQPGLDQFAASPPPPPYWTTAATNWNLVCNGALMIAALSVAESDPRAARLFALCGASVTIGFGEYGPDGGWVEGPGYWHYATQYAIYLLDSLATALGTDLGLDASPGISRTGFFRLHAAGPSGKLFNFADSEERHSGGYWLFWLGKRYRHPVDAWIAQHRGKAHPMDLLWFDENERDPFRLTTAKRFRGAQVAMLRGGWRSLDETYLGIKGGANNSCRHAHYDLGSFVLDAVGVRWAMDLGPDNYGLPDYFTPEMRSRYYRTSTIGHNTIVIDGQCQPTNARALITRSNLRAGAGVVVMDLSEAYPGAALALRGFALIDRRHVLIVDEIVPKEPLSSVDWQMHTTASVALGDATATLTQPAQSDGAEPPRCYLRVIDRGSAALSLVSATPSGPPGQNPNTGVTKLVLHLDQVAQPVRLAVMLSPDSNAAATFEMPPALQCPVSEWVQPAERRARRAEPQPSTPTSVR